MTQNYNTTIAVSASTPQNAQMIANVLQNFATKVTEGNLVKIAEKIKADPNFFVKISPYLNFV